MANATTSPAVAVTPPPRPLELGAGALAFFALPALADELRGRDEYRRAGVTAATLVRDEHATVVLVALRRGAAMREHRAPSAATVVVLAGRVAFLAEREPARTELGPGALAAFAADVPHAVEALEDAAYLVAIGGRVRPQTGA
jgi:quercetin dioxygenase-like cupin family protein